MKHNVQLLKLNASLSHVIGILIATVQPHSADKVSAAAGDFQGYTG